ncbi:MAG TPA: hypothetical protein PKA64_13710 [Myxococcota bacterium]|nr:hypothetical protein [Myxococcota bacterium]
MDWTPNQYDLTGRALTVHYATTSISGVPLMAVSWEGEDRAFRGDEIQVNDAGIGTLVTVVWHVVPDLGSTSLSILLPPIQLKSPDATFWTGAIVTRGRSSIAGPAVLDGALAEYRTIRLRGRARAIIS